MGAPEIDYEAVLADLRARRDRLDATIAGIEQVAGVSRNAEAVGGIVNGAVGLPESTDEHLPRLGSDTFFGLSAVEGAKKYLSIIKRPAPMVAIHDALKAGGYLTNSQNFYANLYTAVMRSTDFQKVGKNWGLAEWYVGRRMPGPPPPTPRKKAKKKTPRKATAKAKKAAVKAKASEPLPSSNRDESADKAPID